MTRVLVLSMIASMALSACVGESRAPRAPEPARPIAAVPRLAPAPLQPAMPPVHVRADFQFEGVPVQGALLMGHVPSATRSLTYQGDPVDVADDGFFIVGLDRDAPAEVLLIAQLDGGRSVERRLSVTPGDWKMEYVNVPYRAGVSSAAFEARRGPELARINASRRQGITSQGWRQEFIWPVAGRQSGYFGSQRVYQGKAGSYHGGADIAVPTGTIFVAPADGVVTLAAEDDFTLEGKLIIVDHGMGLNSAFLHASEILVREGDRVKQGQPIGKVGQSGRATGPHLHWGLKWNDARIDPLLVAGPPRR